MPTPWKLLKSTTKKHFLCPKNSIIHVYWFAWAHLHFWIWIMVLYGLLFLVNFSVTNPSSSLVTILPKIHFISYDGPEIKCFGFCAHQDQFIIVKFFSKNFVIVFLLYVRQEHLTEHYPAFNHEHSYSLYHYYKFHTIIMKFSSSKLSCRVMKS